MSTIRNLATAASVILPLSFAAPAQATGGFVCRTASGPATEIALGFGHVPGAPLIGVRYTRDGEEVAVHPAQWWFDGKELRLHLTDPEALKTVSVVRARAMDNPGMTFDGQIEEAGERRWVRCYEG